VSRQSQQLAKPPLGFVPGILVEDTLAAYYLRQVSLRLRREICWLWHERGVNTNVNDESGVLPPFIDPLAESLDMARHDSKKQHFFYQDETAAYLTKLIAERMSKQPLKRCTGSFGWLVQRLELTPVDCFILALALSSAVDSANGAVLAACQNDPNRILPTPALAQRLWDSPEDVLAVMEPGHKLTLMGLFQCTLMDWNTPLQVSSLLVRQLLFPSSYNIAALKPINVDTMHTNVVDRDVQISRLRSRTDNRLCLLPVTGPSGHAIAQACVDLAAAADLELVRPEMHNSFMEFSVLLTLAWLKQKAILVSAKLLLSFMEQNGAMGVFHIPIVVFVEMDHRTQLNQLPSALPTLHVPELSYQQRLQCWRNGMQFVQTKHLQATIFDCARRFHYEADAIARICDSLMALRQPLETSDLYRACRSDVELGELAQSVSPRFAREELILPAKQSSQIDDLIQAVKSLTAVHYEWGTANAWNEGGLSVLFGGPPGTGKTMAAEVIAKAVDMPLYRIDLSQVVNKYIGETEKNLRKLFDAADKSDVILFFDEADALFGKRTEVKDAHDRYANLEVSYLLERMERFRGIAILASNRKKDLDEAFLRRLRYVIDFPLPGVAERRRIWRYALPQGVDAASLDLDYISERITLSGGHIRSIIFNACLQSEHLGNGKVLDMSALVRALKMELDKLGRTVSLEQFGPYAHYLEENI